MVRFYSLGDLKSSRIQYDKNPPRFLFWISMTIFLGLIAVLILAFFSYKTEVIHTGGILSTKNKTYIMPKIEGEITHVYVNSGEYVQKGDLLFELNDIEVYSRIIANKEKSEMLKFYVDYYDSILTNIKLININKEINNPFIQKTEEYKEFNAIILAINEKTTLEEKQEVIDTYITQYIQTKFQYEFEYIAVKSEINAYEKMQECYKIYANESGFVDFLNEPKKGMIVSNSIIGTISEKITKENSIVELYVNASHKAYVDIDMEVEMVVSGISQSKYGLLKGKIISISNDSFTNDNNVFYIVKVRPYDIILEGENQKLELSNGMVVDTVIKYETITWMEWILKKMGIIDR